MSNQLDIDELLKAGPSRAVGRELLKWANATRERILGGEMMIGLLTPAEVRKIPKAYRKAAEWGAADAWVALGWWYASPEYGEPDFDKSEEAMKAARDARAADAALDTVRLRWFYKRELATPIERKEAYEMITQLAQAQPQNPVPAYLRALLKTHGFGSRKSAEEGVALQLIAAKLGSADAMFELSLHYATGIGVAVDVASSVEWCRRAAKAGNARAMYNLGAMSATGEHMPRNTREAIKWYQRAANAGNPSAFIGLAAIYAKGDGVKQDLERASAFLDGAEDFGMDVGDVRKRLGL